MPPTDGIDHRQQRRRHLHEGDAAHPAGRGKAGQVADHAAAERDDRRVAAGFQFGQRGEDARGGIERLVRFAIGKYQGGKRKPPRPASTRSQVQRRDDFVADDEHVASATALSRQRAASSSNPAPIQIG